MTALLPWLVVLAVAGPIALLALILYPIICLFAPPLRLIGISVKAVFDLPWAMISPPARVLKADA